MAKYPHGIANAMSLPRLYTDLASWWPLVSPPGDYADEAAAIVAMLREALGQAPATILELGSGGGNNAFYFKQHARMTLVDLSPGMLEVSRRLNPEAEHLQGDMRSVRLGRTFDAVVMHDAIMYMTTEADLIAALVTAFKHLRARRCRDRAAGLRERDVCAQRRDRRRGR
jgi:SAM-dependent methyltransferase